MVREIRVPHCTMGDMDVLVKFRDFSKICLVVCLSNSTQEYLLYGDFSIAVKGLLT